MRHLASIQRVWDVLPIDGADRLELAKTLGWQCVVNKGQFKKGDLGVYFEIDSFLPVRPEFEFLRASSYKKTDIMGEGFRLRSMKFRGQLSQGLLLPINTFAELPPELDVGQDVTELLGVKKWEIEERATTGGNVIGALPYDIPHSDETRCFVGKTKILTNKGLIYISDIVNKKIKCDVLTFNDKAALVEWKPVVNYFKRKAIEPLCKITFPFKYNENKTNTLTGSLNHKIMTQNGWTELGQIEKNDLIYLPSERYDEEVLQFIAGMLLGDSSIRCEHRTNKDGSIYKKRRISFTQGEKQLEYLKEKLRLLGCKNNIIENKSGYCNNKVYQTTLNTDDTIELWLNELFGDKKNKIITKEYVQYLTPISFAFLYMDDGCLQQYKDGRNWKPQITLATEAYSKEENEHIVSRLLDYGIEAKIYEENKRNKKKYYNIHLSTEQTDKFQSLIAKYIHPSMRYKLEEKYRNIEYALENYQINKSIKLVCVPVLTKDIINPSVHNTKGLLYNLETENNHTYFANRVLVHNCQAEPELIQAFAGLEYYISTKMDGSSHSIGIDQDGVHICGHNYEYSSGSFYDFVKQKGYDEKIEEFAKLCNYMPFTVQGEFCAPGIQKNPLRLTKPEWYVFTVRVNGKRVGLDDMLAICKELDIPTVPIEEVGTDLPSKYPTVEAVLERADGNYSTGGRKEGIVIRPTEPVYNETIGGPLSMKAVSNKYLLKQE